MTLRKLPAAANLRAPKGYSADPPSDVLVQWADGVHAAEADDPSTISIYDVIGEDWFGEGFSEKRMAGALRAIGKNPVTVNINSPGGDMFAGLTIYNLLREHPAKVTVKVLGLAASAASIIAMAGDEILMAPGSTMMVHRSWGMYIGNTFDFEEASAIFGSFDEAMATIYAARTEKTEKEILAIMDGPRRGSDGTFMSAAEAIDQGFADGMADGTAALSALAEAPPHVSAKRRMDAVLAKAGVARVERRRLFADMAGGTQDAASTVTQDAGLAAATKRLIDNFHS